MRRTRAAAMTGALLAVCASLFTAIPSAQAADSPGFHVQDGRLLDATGQDFVMRGVNHAHAWYPDRTDQALKDIKAKGANSVRVVLATGDRWAKNGTADVTHVVEQCKQNRLVCVLEAHDTTGYGEAGAAVPLSKAVDYWLSVKDALVGQEKYVLINIGNEPYGNTNYTAWTAETKTAIGRLRAAGIHHALMADAPNWGQDWSFTMRDNAAQVFAADPDRNTLFDIHMYGVYDSPAKVTDYLGRFVAAHLPLTIGEFGNKHSDGDPDEDAIMAAAQTLGIGYLGWSWSGNGGGVEYLDLVRNFDANQLSDWGTRLFDGPNGIRSTAKEAGVFGGGTGPGQQGSCAVTYRLSDWGSSFNADVTTRNTSARETLDWKLDFTFSGRQKINSVWNAKAVQSGTDVHITPEAWTRSLPAGGSVGFGLSGSSVGPNTIPGAFVLNGTTCAVS
ncbi:Mannan endo-1,4-beta-mannosidase [Streptomyces hundungensis]|uniref:Endoglucanase n=1 Tax=Streptomyces hundungensis TaxID=1077946 RepID=A0A387H3U0_9ACTN|nr:cellulase family glycosylhydrolase [Streptomyces hundungensis]AYG78365.1 Mannan endo-1,4-beta-mannosidase [Streptomyces hundungensis]